MARSERYRRCRRCGAKFPAPTMTDRTLCDACRKLAKQESVIRPRICTECGVTFDGGPRSKYCQKCRAERRRERDRAYHKNGPARKIGSIQICERCGAEYTLDGGMQRYCPACAETAVRENRRPKKRVYQSAYDPDHSIRNANKIGVRLCVICGASILGDRAKLPFVTCSDACDRIRRSAIQAEADAKRGPRKTGGA